MHRKSVFCVYAMLKCRYIVLSKCDQTAVYDIQYWPGENE